MVRPHTHTPSLASVKIKSVKEQKVSDKNCSQINRSKLLDGDIQNSNFVVRFVCFRVGLHVGDILHDVHASHHSSKDRVFVVQPRLQGSKKKFTPVEICVATKNPFSEVLWQTNSTLPD